MSIIHTVLSPSELARISQKDSTYLRRKLETNTLLNTVLHKTINRPLLSELPCVLDRKPIARRKIEQRDRHSKVSVFKGGKLVRIEHSNGKVMKEI